MRYGLLFPLCDPGSPFCDPLLSPCGVSPGLLRYLSGSRENIFLSSPSVETVPFAGEEFSPGSSSVKGMERSLQFLGCFAESRQTKAPVLILQGPKGTGKEALVRGLASRLDRRVIRVELALLLAEEKEERHLRIREILAETTLFSSLLFVKDAPLLGGHEPEYREIRSRFFRLAEESGTPLVLEDTGSLDYVHEIPRGDFFLLELQPPSFTERAAIWEGAFVSEGAESSLSPDRLASRFRFSGEQIRNAVRNAKLRTISQRGAPDGSSVAIPRETLLDSCRAQAGSVTGNLVHRVETAWGWEDLVVEPEQMQRLKEIAYYMENLYGILDESRFGEKYRGSQGVNVLFSGSSGTGKTMAAGVIAREIGLDLYRINLATVVSKYIGDTEKNLDEIFEAARDSHAVIFFDEADALFGKRSEVKDSKDRYSNIEVGYLLQKMEEYEGMTVLATNLEQNLDEAFLRRMQFIVRFPHPGERELDRLWRSLYPREALLAEELDFEFLTKRIKMPGGNLRNIALLSGAFARAENSGISMRHILWAVRREFEKLQLNSEEYQFKPYDALFRDPIASGRYQGSEERTDK